MSLPTRILLGMVAGVALGLALGPRSALLSRDTLVIRQPERVTLRAAPDPDARKVTVRTGVPLRLRVLGERRGADGQSWYELHLRGGDRGVEAKAPPAPPTDGEKGGAARARGAGTPKDGENEQRAGQGAEQDLTVYLPVDRAPPRVSALGYDVIRYVSPVGRLFLRLIKMVIVPLVFCSLLVGVASLGDLGKLGKMGGLTVGYFLSTTALAITVGLVLANAAKPGRYVEPRDREQLSRGYAEEAEEKTKTEDGPGGDTFLDRLVDMVPDVPLHAATRHSPNMLQVIVFALFMGIAFMLVPGDKARPALSFFESINEVMITIVQIVMELAPFGVLALLAAVTGSTGLSVLGALAAYTGVVLAALAIHGTVTYGAAVKLLARYPLRRFYGGIRPAQLIAFSTSSSSATLPVSIRVAQQNLGVSGRAASFVLPLGATINMDGTALYQGVAAVFIAQVFGLDLSLGQQLEVLFTATLASVGAAGVPGAGIITLAMVLTSIGVPTAGVALILGVDRLLDMFRTAVNVTGDLSCTVFVAGRTGELGDPDAAPSEGEAGSAGLGNTGDSLRFDPTAGPPTEEASAPGTEAPPEPGAPFDRH